MPSGVIFCSFIIKQDADSREDYEAFLVFVSNSSQKENLESLIGSFQQKIATFGVLEGENEEEDEE